VCKPDEFDEVRVLIPADLSSTGQAKWKLAQIDKCISQLVRALQSHGIDMRGSCCGHGETLGHIDLQDGRGLLILTPQQNSDYMSKGILPQINGRQQIIDGGK